MSLASLTVDCDDGTVTLQGEVDNSFKKWSAEQTAGRIDGVRIVANAISVKPKQQQKDSAIAQNIEKTLTLTPVSIIPRSNIQYSKAVSLCVEKFGRFFKKLPRKRPVAGCGELQMSKTS